MKKWIEIVKKGLSNEKEIEIQYIIDNISINIKPYGDSFEFKKQHAKQGFGETTIQTLEDVLYSLKQDNKPDMLFIGEKEVNL